MKKFALLFFVMADIVVLSAQDLVVTHSGDSINAKITRIKAGYLYINYRVGNKIVNTLLPPDSVTFYQYDFYNFSDVPRNKVIMREDVSKWRVALNGGWSWRVAQTDPSLNSFEKDYINGLKSGHAFGGEACFYFHRLMGVGLVYNAHLSSNSVEALAQFEDGSFHQGVLSDDILINFIGPTFNMRFVSRKTTNAFVIQASIGYSGYRDNFGFNGDTLINKKITGNTVGINFDCGYDYTLSKHFAIGAGISLKAAALSSFKVTENNSVQTINLDQNSYESLARADIFIGIRFR